MTFKFPYRNSNIKNEILNFIKTYVTINTFHDIKTILEPCCKPTISIAEDSTSCSGSDTVFSDITVSTVLKSKTVTLIFTFTDYRGTQVSSTSLIVDTDSSGNWTGEVVLYDYVTTGLATLTVGVVAPNSQVISTSTPIVVTGISNCN